MKYTGIPFVAMKTVEDSQDVESKSGLEIAIIGSKNEISEVKGAYVSGGYNITKGTFRGVNVAGVCNSQSTAGVSGRYGTTGGSKGVNLAGVCNLVDENADGINVAGVYNRVSDCHSFGSHGVHIAGIANSIRRAEGLTLAGLVNSTDESIGVSVALLANASKSYTGLTIAGLINDSYCGDGVSIAGLCNVNEMDAGGLQVAGGINYSHEVGCYHGKYLIQASILGNWVKEVSSDATVIQIGLYNRAGDRFCPVVNVKGIRNLFRRKKKK
ncbi:MAG: hypothetical protein ABIJ21_01090 [Nanoarchaeota archaeon]